MSGTRPLKKGSFAGHLDELVKHFHHEPDDRQHSRDGKRKSARLDGHDVHNRLFESAWRKAREAEPPG